jgi:cytochrome bd ubiquinol oxidase subunit II
MAEIAAAFILAGLAAYTVLAGADFGAGLWTLLDRPGRASPTAIRDHCRHALGPVWEANHVWLVFVLVVCWTAFPVAFGSIMSTLSVPLFVAAVGIILRGASYALRGQLVDAPGRRRIEALFAASSILTPFALGTVVGGIASGRVPVGNAAGNLVTSWLNPTSIMVGALAVATGAYLAAVYLAADARRLGKRDLELDFRTRALVVGVCAGALALGGLAVVRVDAPALFTGLTHDGGAVMVALSIVAGLTTLVLVWLNHFGAARASAALAVAAIVAGWGLAQRPIFLPPGLTVEQAAASRSTLLATIIAVAVGALVLVPSLILLFLLYLRGHLGPAPATTGPSISERATAATRPRQLLLAAFALATLLVGLALTLIASPGWILGIGVVCLVACAVSTFVLATVDVPD